MKKNLTSSMKKLLVYALVLSLLGLFSSCSKRTYSAFKSEPAATEQNVALGSPYSPFLDKIPENQWPTAENLSINENDFAKTGLLKKIPLNQKILAKALLKTGIAGASQGNIATLSS